MILLPLPTKVYSAKEQQKLWSGKPGGKRICGGMKGRHTDQRPQNFLRSIAELALELVGEGLDRPAGLLHDRGPQLSGLEHKVLRNVLGKSLKLLQAQLIVLNDFLWTDAVTQVRRLVSAAAGRVFRAWFRPP